MEFKLTKVVTIGVFISKVVMRPYITFTFIFHYYLAILPLPDVSYA